MRENGNRAGRKLTTSRLPACFACLSMLLAASSSAGGAARQDAATGVDSKGVARMLSSRNPVQRREAAEALARAASVEHRRLVEGYRVQESDAKVRLALDWALYRMGKSQALFEVVRALDSSRAEQALQYLSRLETPEPLYAFLGRTNGKTQVRLIEALAHVGDAGTLDKIKPFESSPDPVIAEAAKFAEREITIRLEESPKVNPKRERRVGKADEETP